MAHLIESNAPRFYNFPLGVIKNEVVSLEKEYPEADFSDLSKVIEEKENNVFETYKALAKHSDSSITVVRGLGLVYLFYGAYLFRKRRHITADVRQ